MENMGFSSEATERCFTKNKSSGFSLEFHFLRNSDIFWNSSIRKNLSYGNLVILNG